MTTKMLEEASFKASTTKTGTRILDFYACAFSKTPDKNGDVIDPRALDGWLKTFYAMGKPLPISFAHAAVLDSTDPFQIIGSAPADPQHVWTDDYGLRVKAILNTGSNATARQVASLIDQGIITGASIAFVVKDEAPDEETKAQRILQMEVMEAGPCLAPANTEAVVLALKKARDDLREGVKSPPWHIVERDGQFCVVLDEDGSTVKCHDTRGAAMAHMRALYANAKSDDLEVSMSESTEEVEIKHAKSPANLQAAHDALVRAGAKCASVGEITKSDEQDEVSDRLRRLRFLEVSTL